MSGAGEGARRNALRVLTLCMLCTVSAAHAQLRPLDTTASRQALEDASRDRCDGVSVVVRRCVAQPDTRNSDKADALTRSRARAKAAFDRRDRRTRQDSLDGIDEASGNAAGGTGSGGTPQRLAPVVVTGNAAEPGASVEEILQRALNPQVVSQSGTVTTYGPDGVRKECIARCVGPMCCLTLRNRPDPARDSSSIGR